MTLFFQEHAHNKLRKVQSKSVNKIQNWLQQFIRFARKTYVTTNDNIRWESDFSLLQIQCNSALLTRQGTALETQAMKPDFEQQCTTHGWPLETKHTNGESKGPWAVIFQEKV